MLRVDHVGGQLVAGRHQLQHHPAERPQHVLGRLHLVLDRHLAHQHHQPARRVLERTARRARVALRAGPDLLLHGIPDAFQVLGPQKLHDLARREVVVVRRRARRGADAAVEAAVELVVEAKIPLQVVEDRLQLGARNRRRIAHRIADIVLVAGGCVSVGHVCRSEWRDAGSGPGTLACRTIASLFATPCSLLVARCSLLARFSTSAPCSRPPSPPRPDARRPRSPSTPGSGRPWSCRTGPGSESSSRTSRPPRAPP